MIALYGVLNHQRLPGVFGNECGGDAHNGFIVPCSSLKCLLLSKMLLANSKTKLILSESSQYCERENRIRQQHLSNCILKAFFQHESKNGACWQEACLFEVGDECQS